MERYFAFSSGGAYHFQGRGDWKIRVDERGTLTVEHNVFGAVTGYGPYQLLPAESRSLWECIEAAGFDRRSSSRRRGNPDEALLAFALFSGEKLHSAQLWAGEAFDDHSITSLINWITELIGKYTGKEPVLR